MERTKKSERAIISERTMLTERAIELERTIRAERNNYRKRTTTMGNFSPVPEEYLEGWVTYHLRMLKCRKAASNAHDPRFKELWLQKADQIRENWKKGLQ